MNRPADGIATECTGSVARLARSGRAGFANRPPTAFPRTIEPGRPARCGPSRVRGLAVNQPDRGRSSRQSGTGLLDVQWPCEPAFDEQQARAPAAPAIRGLGLLVARAGRTAAGRPAAFAAHLRRLGPRGPRRPHTRRPASAPRPSIPSCVDEPSHTLPLEGSCVAHGPPSCEPWPSPRFTREGDRDPKNPGPRVVVLSPGAARCINLDAKGALRSTNGNGANRAGFPENSRRSRGIPQPAGAGLAPQRRPGPQPAERPPPDARSSVPTPSDREPRAVPTCKRRHCKANRGGKPRPTPKVRAKPEHSTGRPRRAHNPKPPPCPRRPKPDLQATSYPAQPQGRARNAGSGRKRGAWTTHIKSTETTTLHGILRKSSKQGKAQRTQETFPSYS